MKKLTVVVWVIGLACAAMFASLLAVRVFFIGASTVGQNGMYPTIPRGSRLLYWKRAYATVADVKRGDIVLFERVQRDHRFIYVWRVVALPGDRVRAVGDELSVNGAPLERERVSEEEGAVIFREASGDHSYLIAVARSPERVPPEVDTVVGPDEVFVLGDNRYHALDSRYSGPIPFASIVGKRF